jgi:two-component system, cell cycle sensor histidine kinase and response regulator CckA
MKTFDSKKLFYWTSFTFALLLFLGGSAFYVWNRVHESEAWISHSYQVIQRMEALLSDIKDGEGAQRGYLLTGIESFLESYPKDATSFSRHLSDLRNMSVDNPNQQQRLRALDDVVTRKMDHMDKTISIRRTKGLPAAMESIIPGTGKKLMDEIRAIADGFKDEERSLLKTRLDNRNAEMQWLANLVGVLFAGLLGMLLVLLSQARMRARAEETIRRTSTQLHQSEERFRLLVEGVKDYALYMLDPDGKVVTWTPSAARIHGYEADEIMGAHFGRFYSEEDLAAKKPHIVLSVAAAEGHFQSEGWQMKKDGTPFWANILVTPIKSSTGAIQGFSKLVRDDTEQKKTQEMLHLKEQELYQARKMEAVGRLAGGVAHDFNNLMTGIIGLSQDILLDKEVQNRRDDVEEIVKAAQRATHLTKQLLAFSRRQFAAPVVLNLNELIVDMQKMLRRLIGEDVELTTMLDPRAGNIKADPGQIEQIIVNLVLNSKDAMKGGGKITIETSNADLTADYVKRHFEIKPGAYVMMVVSDTGSGIDPAIQPQIFEPFFTTKEKDKGTGLGLATVYGIVKQNGGDIFLYSHPGQGTIFKIYLPRVNDPKPAERHKDAAAQMPRGTETILIVEDEEVVRRVATRALTAQGYKVLEARSGKDALEISAAYSDPIHLLLTDVVMPGINGRQLAEMLEPQRLDMRVLYMSGYTENIIVTRGILKSGIAFLEKSFTAETLCQKVREVLDSSRKSSVV